MPSSHVWSLVNRELRSSACVLIIRAICTQEKLSRPRGSRLSECQKALLILLAGLFEACVTSNAPRKQRTHLGRRKVVCSWENQIFHPFCIHLLKPSLIEEILLTAQSTSAHYALMICPLFQSVLFDYASKDTNFLGQNSADEHESYFFTSGKELASQQGWRAGAKQKNMFNKTFRNRATRFSPWWK